MKVWFPAIRFGTGADVFTNRLVASLRERGVEAVITWFPPWCELVPGLMRRHPIPVGTDVIHTNGWLGSPFIGLGVPVVTTVHHLVHDPAYAPYRSAMQALYHRVHVRWREARAIAGSDCVTAISEYVAGTVRDQFGRDEVEVIYNWVDTNLYCPSTAYSPDTSRPFRLLLSGNASRRKGIDLLPALSAALGDGFEIRITGGLRGGEIPAGANITLLGRLDEPSLILEYQFCDAVISLSRYEGFGYSALEGMACAKPFLGFHTSGLAEVVDDGVTGILSPIDSVGALASSCMLLRRSLDLLHSMGEAGRDAALIRFSEQRALDSYQNLYKRCNARIRFES